jgi:TolB protein
MEGLSMKKFVVLMMTLLLTLAACQPGATPTTAPAPAPTATTVSEATPPTPTATSVPPTPTATLLPPLSGSGGGRIAFCSRRGEGDYEVYVMNADGTDKRQVTRDAFDSEGPKWSPDGTQIAFSLSTYTGHTDIRVINADGSNPRRLTTSGGTWVAWSPDGTRIAFSLSKPNSDVYVMDVPDGTDADNPDQQRLTKTDRNVTVGNPVWSPDGTQIVCVVSSRPAAREPGGKSTLYVLNVQEALQSGGASIADMRPLPRAGKDVNDRPTWSPTGSQIVFSAVVDGHRDLYVVNADGTDLRQLTHTPDFDEWDPAWSPDGTQIVFQANPDANWDIYVMDVPDGTDVSNWRRLTTDVANDCSPDWAP